MYLRASFSESPNQLDSLKGIFKEFDDIKTIGEILVYIKKILALIKSLIKLFRMYQNKSRSLVINFYVIKPL